MEIVIFTLIYLVSTIFNIQDMNNILHIGIAISLVAIFICKKNVVFKTIYVAIVLSTIIFNFHEKMEKERDYITDTKEFTAVATEIEQKYESYSTIIANVNIDGDTFKSKIYFENNENSLLPGDKITGDAYIYAPTYKTGFDRENYYKSQGINVLMSANTTEFEYSENITIFNFFTIYREKIKEKLQENFDLRTSSFIKALVLGDKSDFDSFFSIDVQKAGISHILAVSGMHVGFLASLCMAIFGKRYGGIFSAIVITSFLFIVGPSPSILRAIIMQYMVIIAWFINRENSSKNSICVAFVILIIFEPYILYDVGFVLSFASTLGIIYLYPYIYKKLKCRFSKINKIIISSLSVSISVICTTIIPLFYYFDYISTVTIISNLLIIPIICIVFPLCIAYIMLIFLPKLILLPFTYIITFLIYFTREIITFIANFKYSIVLYDYKLIVLLYIIMSICVVFFRIMKFEKTVIYLSILIFTSVCIYSSYKSYSDFNMHIFSVGDGQCILITNKNEVTLIDCGSSSYYNASDLVNEFMYKYSYDYIDNIVITSIDNTHIKDLIWLNYDAKNIIFPENRVRADAENFLKTYINDRSIPQNQKLPEYITVFDNVDKKLAILVEDTLILHGFTNLMLEEFIESNEITAKRVVLADKTILEYKRLEAILIELGVEEVILSNDYDMLSRVSGVKARTTAQYGDIIINFGGNYDKN